MKCEICGKNIATTFLEKIKGTRVKDSKGKHHAVCFECQKTLKDKAEILGKLR